MSNSPYLESRARVLAGCALLALVAAGCSDEKRQQDKAESPPKTAVANDAPEKIAMAEMDVSILVKPCIEGGIAAKACECAGEAAKTMIGPELLAKMAKAPKEGDAALQSYYTRPEIGRIMKWVDDGGKKCGIEEEE